MIMSCSSSSVTSAVAVGGTRACVGEADGPGVDVETGYGGEIADGGVQERRNRPQQRRLGSYFLKLFALRLGQIARQRLRVADA